MDSIDKTSIREKAQERIKFLESVPEVLNQEQLLKLAQELQVYKIELEIQNEELLKAQERINNSYERFYSLFHNAPVGYLICNEVGIISKANATFYYMTKIDYDIAGKAVVDFLVDEDREILLSRYKAFFKNPIKKQIEVRLKTAKNTNLYCRLEGRVFSLQLDGKEQKSEILISFSDITEIKRTELQLLQERDLFTAGPVLTIEWDPSEGWPVSYVSSNVEFILGYMQEEMLNKHFRYSQLIHPDDIARVSSEVNYNILNNNDVFEQSYRMKTKSGEYRWFYDFTKFARDDKGVLTKIFGYVIDQTNTKLNEIQLHEERTRLDNIIKGTNIGTWEWNIQTGETIFNERWAEIIGYSLAELAPVSINTWSQFAHPEDLNQSNEQLKKHFNGELDYYECESRMRHKSGKWIWVLDRGRIVSRSKEGLPLMMYGTHTDITKQKEEEELLLKSDLRYKLITETSIDGFWIIDLQGRLLSVNDAYCDLIKYSREELLQMSIYDLDVNENYDDTMNHIKEIMDKGYGRFETQHKCKDGKIVDVEISTTYSKSLNSIMVFINDITERKNYKEHLEDLVQIRTNELNDLNKSLLKEIEHRKLAENKLEGLLQKEIELNTLKSRFISTASHEFRTPLTSILASAELILKYNEKWSTEKKLEHLNRIKNSASTLTKLMDDVIKVNRAESGNAILDLSHVNLHLLCKKVIEDNSIHLKNEHNLIFDFIGNDTEYLLDPRFVESILQNLLSNAIKYSPNGGTIKFSVIASLGEVQIKIADSGLGIPNEDIPNIFKPFQRANNTKDIQGTGLGLSIVKHAVDIHNGTIEVSSQEGVETTFVVRIPFSN